MNKFTLITGACGGLGRALVSECAKAKENLVLVGTSQKKLDLLLKDFEAQFEGLEVKTFVCNLGDAKNRAELAVYLKENEISVTKLINNAGVIIEGDIVRFSDEEIANAIEVNCIGTLDLTKKLIEARDKNEKFEVLTIASQAAFQPIPHMGVYAATKSFLLSIMTALSEEFKDENVVITTSCPSGMATTDAMKESIKSMGINGKLTTLPVEKVAKISLKALKRKKKIVVPGKFNKFVEVISRPLSQSFLAKTTGKMWRKSQAKRNF
ncbi:MAG: SDR family NAD(P)-dependent oxidoreductase [Clostridia bacterium]|nr:SDR family NAD(P)-dependent oxidoreductase [Clostridia bacterium]